MFRDRAEAGRLLAAKLASGGHADPIVLALPRGGVPVGAAIAQALHAPLDLILVRKIGVPFQPELAAAALVDGTPAQVVPNPPVLRAAGIDMEDLSDDIAREKREIERRRKAYLSRRTRASVAGRTVIVVDDGIATGTTVRAALLALRNQKPGKLILAVPVAPREALQALASDVDVIVCLEQPEPFHDVGMHYHDFRQLSDSDVVACLKTCDASGGMKAIRNAQTAA